MKKKADWVNIFAQRRRSLYAELPKQFECVLKLVCNSRWKEAAEQLRDLAAACEAVIKPPPELINSEEVPDVQKEERSSG